MTSISSIGKRECLEQPIQMQLSQKVDKFFQFLFAFPKCRSNFEHFEKKFERHTCCISEVIDSKKRGYLNV